MKRLLEVYSLQKVRGRVERGRAGLRQEWQAFERRRCEEENTHPLLCPAESLLKQERRFTTVYGGGRGG